MYERKTLADLGIDHIVLEDKRVYIDRNNPIVGTGGTCIVYNAWRTHKNSMGNDIKSRIILKEFYPTLVKGVDTRKERTNEKVPRLLQSELYSQQKGEDEYSEYNAKLERFKNSFDIFSKLYNGSTNGDTVHAYTITEANDTIYIMADYSDAISLSEYMKKDITIYDFVYALMKTVEAVHSLHTFRECTYEGESDNNEGYLHLDITPGNILYHERNRYASIMDTDSFVKKNDLKEGKKEIWLSASSGYSAPELCINISEEIRKTMINERTDVYSVGAIFYEYIMREKAENNGEGGRYGYEDMLEEMLRKRYRDCPRHAVKLVKEFLRKALSKKQSKRYADMQKTAEALSGMLEWLEPKHVYIQDNYNPNNKKVYGRESKIKLIEEKLAMQGGNGRSRVVCISGIGGIGKSTLAKEYAKIHESDYEVITEVKADSAKGAVLQIGITNLKELEEVKGDQTTDLEYFNIKKRKLAELMSEHRTLLIVHDYNTEEDDFSTWYELGCDIILTGWHEWKETVVKGIRLKSSDLSEENEFGAAVKIFESGYVSNAVEESDKEWEKRLLSILEKEETEVREITRCLNYHPLSINVLAKQMASESGAEIHPRKMLDEIEQSGIQRHRGLEVQNEKDGYVRENDAYGHLEWIFGNAVKNGRLDDEEKEILRYMTLVPSESGISIPRFKKWTGLEGEGILSRAVKKGWIEYNSKGVDYLDNDNKDGIVGTYHMPMVISEVLYRHEGMKSTVDNSVRFINACCRCWVNSWALVREQIMIVIKHMNEEESEKYAETLDRLAFEFCERPFDSNDKKSVLKYQEKALKIYRKIYGEENEVSVGIYERMGYIFLNTGEKKKGMECMEKALKICKKIYREENEETARSYEAIGDAFLVMGEKKNGVMCMEKALKIRRKIYGEESVETARSYEVIGEAFLEMREKENGMALVCMKKAIKIRRKIRMRYHDSYYDMYIYLGHRYFGVGEKKKAMECMEKALEICEEEASYRADSYVANSYETLGKAYFEIGEKKKGMEYMEKALEIRIKIYVKEPETATSYYNVGKAYFEMGEKKKGMEYMEKALKIRIEIYVKKALRTGESYYNVGKTYFEMGEKKKGMEYMEKTLEIRIEICGEKALETGKSYYNVGKTYFEMGEKKKGMEYMEKALEIGRAELYERDSKLEAFFFDQEKKKGIEHMEKLLEKCRYDESREIVCTANIYNDVGKICFEMGEKKKGMEYMKKALKIRREKKADDLVIARSYENIGCAYAELGEFETAVKYTKQAYEIKKRTLGKVEKLKERLEKYENHQL